MRNFHISSLFTVFFIKKPAKMNLQHNKKQRRELVVQGSPKESSRLVRGAGVVLYEALPEPRTEREPR